jgi:glycerophosphoryl diester phosphodiesterase
MMLNDILEMWKKDSVIDEMTLDESSRESAKLHSKYLELLSVARLRLKKLELEFKPLLRDKFLHYGGKLSQEEMDQKKWDYDPLNGLTVLKGDLDKWYDADPIIQEHQSKIIYQEELVSTLKEILDNIKWRHQTIKNMIEWRKFTSGV